MARTRAFPLPKAGIAPNGTKYVVKFDRDWQEWQVQAYKNSPTTGAWKFAEGPTCYCGDREEAISTFHHLVGHAPGYTRSNPSKRRNPYNIEESASRRGEYVGYGAGTWRIWRYYRNGDFIAVKSRGGPRKELRASTLTEMSKLLAGEASPTKTNPVVIKAQQCEPSGRMSRTEAVAEIRKVVKQDAKDCRRKFGTAIVEVSKNTVWEVRPLKSKQGPLWSRYSIHEV